MNILLVGEYNRAHRNIKLGLEQLGHKATVVGLTDGFKKVEVDIKLKNYFENWITKKIRILFVRFFNVDLLGLYLKYKIKKKNKYLSGYDIVQFINEAPFLCDRKNQENIFSELIAWNGNAYLLSCGTDYISVKYAFEKKYRNYSILTPFFENKGSKKNYLAAFDSITPAHRKLHKFLFKSVEGVISNDLDYHIPLKSHPKYLGMIPHAIDMQALKYTKPKIEDKVIIFHGINRHNYFKKGNDIFESALDLIFQKHPDKIEILTVENLPYKEYIKSLDKAHILMDQIYAYDQGFNALEAMAKGKVVFTGAEKEWLEYYNVEEDSICINALPNSQKIAEKLEWLILNPEKINEISLNARKFVEEHHNHIDCAKKYLETWNRNS